MNKIRGLDSDDELKIDKVRRNTEKTSRTFINGISEPPTSAFLILLTSVWMVVQPESSFVVPLIATALYFFPVTKEYNKILPIHLPLSVGGKDKNDKKPGKSNSYYNARGTFMLGNLRKNMQELWISSQSLLTHILLIGTTGAGKTETLVSLGSNVIAMGSGLIYVDAKAAPKLLFQIATLARMFGRDDDLRVINYITGAQSIAGQQALRLSNTTNPFAVGSPDTAVQTLTSLIPSSGGDNQIFADRAIALINAVMPAMVDLRENHGQAIYPSRINAHITLNKFIDLSVDMRLEESSRRSIKAYLVSLAGFNEGKSAANQPEEVSRQFGFAQAYFTRVLTSLSDTYGHIYNEPLSEVDFSDVVIRSRILVVMIPAMEKAGEERKALGKVILSSLRAAMALGLGNKIEGDRADVLDSLPTASSIPSMIIVDEYAEVATEGFAVTATQGRGLGFNVTFAGQDLAGFYRASEEEADMIFSNTRLKILMALEDPDKTWGKFEKLAGDAYTSELSGYTRGTGIDPYKKNKDVRITKMARITLQDLKEQDEGQAHIFYKSSVFRAQIFHHGIPDDKLITNFRLNRMLQIYPPDDRLIADLRKLKESAANINALIKKNESSSNDAVLNERLNIIRDSVQSGKFNYVKAFTDYVVHNRRELFLTSSSQMDDTEDDDSPMPAQQYESKDEPSQLGDMSLDLLSSGSEDQDDIPNDVVAKIKEDQFDTEIDSGDCDPDALDYMLEGIAESPIIDEADPIKAKEDSRNLCDSFVKTLKLTGLNDKEANASAAVTINDMSQSVIYPSTVIQKDPEDGYKIEKAIEDLYAAAKKNV